MNTWSGIDGFSVVMAAYGGTLPEHLLQAGESVFNQSRCPDELLIVLDGKVSDRLLNVIAMLSTIGNVSTLQLKENLGPGAARHEGIVAASYDVVAVMDSDDICLPSRFEKQYCTLLDKSADIVGGWIREFETTPGDSPMVRRVPEEHHEILRFAKRRSPMNNVTIMFRKSAYLAAGGYAKTRSFEDYDLFVRMLLGGFRFYNIQEVLVDVRGGSKMFIRRGGLKQIPMESRMLYRFYRSGFFDEKDFVFNWLVRTTMRLLPNVVRQVAYNSILRIRR